MAANSAPSPHVWFDGPWKLMEGNCGTNQISGIPISKEQPLLSSSLLARGLTVMRWRDVTVLQCETCSDGGEEEPCGIYICEESLMSMNKAFEFEVEKVGGCGDVYVGLCTPDASQLEKLPGTYEDSLSFSIFHKQLKMGSSWNHVVKRIKAPLQDNTIHVSISVHPPVIGSMAINECDIQATLAIQGNEVLQVFLPVPPTLHPSIAISGSHIVQLMREVPGPNHIVPINEIAMAVDGSEKDWKTFSKIQITGQVLEYIGTGLVGLITDCGQAQASEPLTTSSHYFEVEILNPGLRHSIMIGLTSQCHKIGEPLGHFQGSIAYDLGFGRLHMAHSKGEPFGPKCQTGDVIGCGILFHQDHTPTRSIEEGLQDLKPFPKLLMNYIWSDNKSEVVHRTSALLQKTVDQSLAQVFFRRNGKLLGIKQIQIPIGGFYPTISMSSIGESVLVHFHPLSG